MQQMLARVPKNGLTPLKLEHIFMFIFGLTLIFFGGELYNHISDKVLQLIILICYLTLLVGVAPVRMPIVKSLFGQVVIAGLISGLLDSFIVLLLCRSMRIEEMKPGEIIKLLVLMTISALIGGLIIWFGEAYAAGLYMNDGRTGVLSALYILPPVLVYLSILGFHAKHLNVKIIHDTETKVSIRDIAEFLVGIGLLLMTHNPALCLGWLLVYAVITRQDDHLLDVWKHHTEVNVMLVLLIALVSGSWLVNNVISPLGLDRGEFLPIIPAGVQAVLWGPLYQDESVHFWMRLTTLSTGALLLPISSLVGVMLFKSPREWISYMRYSFVYALLWYGIMRLWIWLTLDNQIGHFLDQWAHSGGHH